MKLSMIMGIMLLIFGLFLDLGGVIGVYSEVLILVSLVAFGFGSILICYGLKEEREKKKGEEKQYRPDISFRIIIDDEKQKSIKDNTDYSNLIIESVRRDNKPLNVKIRFAKNDLIINEVIFKEYVESNKFSFRNYILFSEKGIYTVNIWFTSKVGYQYRMDVKIECVITFIQNETPWKHWLILPKSQKLFIKERKEWKDITEQVLKEAIDNGYP